MTDKVKERYHGGRQAQQPKSTWRKFLTPGWFLVTLAVIAFSYFAFTTLAPWQLGKDEHIVERNEQIEAAYKADPVPVEQVLAPDDAIDEQDQWTQVYLNGEFLTDAEVLLRLRPVESSPAYHALTPFQLDSGKVILVNRGYVVTNGSNDVPEITSAPSGKIRTEGMVQMSEGPSERPALDDQGYTQVYTMNPEQIGELTGLHMVDGYVQLAGNQPGVLNPIPVPKLDRGSHLSYGLQWLAFGVMAPLGLIYFIVSELKERRRVREEESEMSPDAMAEPSGPSGDDALFDEEDLSRDPDIKVVRRSRNVRDRYGGQKRNHYQKLAQRHRERDF